MKIRRFEVTMATKEKGAFDPNSSVYSSFLIDSCSNMAEAQEVAGELLATLNTSQPYAGWFILGVVGLGENNN